MTRDDTSRTEHQAGISARQDAATEDLRDRDEPGEPGELEHAHGPGLVCLACCLERV